jgi:hypothetical protein
LSSLIPVMRERAVQLLSLGLSRHRAFRMLRYEFPEAERDELHRALPLEGAPKGVTPGWALWGQPLRPTQIRYQMKRKGPPEEPVRVRTPVTERDKQRWIEAARKACTRFP